MTDVVEVIITGPEAEWLAAFTRRLVDDRLVACGHNIASIRSIVLAAHLPDGRRPAPTQSCSSVRATSANAAVR